MSMIKHLERKQAIPLSLRNIFKCPGSCHQVDATLVNSRVLMKTFSKSKKHFTLDRTVKSDCTFGLIWSILTNVFTYEWMYLFFMCKIFHWNLWFFLKMCDYQSKKSPKYTYFFKKLIVTWTHIHSFIDLFIQQTYLGLLCFVKLLGADYV